MIFILTPAYGRDYKSKAAVIRDFLDEKDFVKNPEGCYINRQQIPDGAQVNVRYASIRKVVTFKKGAEPK